MGRDIRVNDEIMSVCRSSKSAIFDRILRIFASNARVEYMAVYGPLAVCVCASAVRHPCKSFLF